MSVNKYPKFILVANLNNKFWNNNSDTYPTTIPDASLYIKIPKTQPVFISPYTAICVLQGEWNHAIYAGKYYHLIKIEIKDIVKGIYKYQMEYDVMIDFINKGGEIRGTLIKTNNEDILKDTIQTCKQILNNPIRLEIGKFQKGSSDDWFPKDFDLSVLDDDKLNKKILYEWKITQDAWDYFWYINENNPFIKTLKTKNWKESKEEGINYKHINPIFLINVLIPELSKCSWKRDIISLLKQTLKNKDKLQIVTQTAITGSIFSGKYAITTTEPGAIGKNKESNLKLLSLDFSTLTDIKPLDAGTGKPYVIKKIKKEYLQDAISQEALNFQPLPYGWCLKLGRKPHLPLKPRGIDTDNNALLPISRNNIASNRDDTKYTGNPPQKVVFKKQKKLSGRVGYLWHVDNLDFILATTGADETPFSSRNVDSTFELVFNNITDRKDLPDIGFLIYQHIKNKLYWDGCEYLGETTLNSLTYRSGLTDKLRTNYSSTKNKWWNGANYSLTTINGFAELSYLTLDIDRFNWLAFAPSDKNLWYSYHTQNDWGIYDFLKNRNTTKYTNDIINSEINSNGVNLKSIYIDSEIKRFNLDKENKLNDISIENSIELDNPIKKGDLFTTNLTHGWRYVTNIYEFPFEWLSEDFYNELDLLNVQEKTKLSDRKSKCTGEVENKEDDIREKQWIYKPISKLWSNRIKTAPHKVWVHGWSSIFNEYRRWAGYDPAFPELEAEIRTNIKSSLLIGDFFDSEYIQSTDLLNNSIVTYLYKGTFYIGEFYESNKTLELDSSNKQIVESVDGTISKNIKCWHIKKIGELLYSGRINEAQKKTILERAVALANKYEGEEQYYFNISKLDGEVVFDLVGTKWYVLIKNNQAHLITKDNDIFEPKDTEVSNLKFSDILEENIYSKINQKSYLYFYGNIRPLNTRFNFSNDKFKVLQKPLKPKNRVSPIEYLLLKTVDTKNDYINEIIKIGKIETDRSTQQYSPTDIEQLNLQIENNQQRYLAEKYLADLGFKHEKRGLLREREDLDYEWSTRMATLPISILQGGVAGGRAARMMGHGGGRVGLIGGAAASLVKEIAFFTRYPTLKERYREDELALIQQNSADTFLRKQNYEHNEQMLVTQLNRITNSFVMTEVSDRDIQNEYVQKEKLGNVHIQTFLPTGEQLKEIEYIYKTFGCECVSDVFEINPLKIYNGMKPGLYQFNKLASDCPDPINFVGSIISPLTTDITSINAVKQIFENGVRFIDCDHQIYTPIEDHETEVSVIPIIFDIENIKDWSKEKWDIYYSRTDKDKLLDVIENIDRYGLTNEEYELNKNKIDKKKLLRDINKIITNRNHVGFTLPKKPKNEWEGEIDNLKNQVRDKNREIIQLKTNINEQTDRVKNIEKDLQSKTQKISDLEFDKTTLEEQKSDLSEQLRQCKINHQNVLNAKDTCDLVNANKIKELQNKLNNCLTSSREDTDLKTAFINITSVLSTIEKQRRQEINDLTVDKAFIVCDPTCRDPEVLGKNIEYYKTLTTTNIIKYTNPYTLTKFVHTQLSNISNDIEFGSLNDFVNLRTQNFRKGVEDVKNKLGELNKCKADFASATKRANTLSESVTRLEAQLTQEKNLTTLYLAEKNRINQEKINIQKQLTSKETELANCKTQLLTPQTSPDNEELKKAFLRTAYILSKFEKTRTKLFSDLGNIDKPLLTCQDNEQNALCNVNDFSKILKKYSKFDLEQSHNDHIDFSSYINIFENFKGVIQILKNNWSDINIPAVTNKYDTRVKEGDSIIPNTNIDLWTKIFAKIKTEIDDLKRSYNDLLKQNQNLSTKLNDSLKRDVTCQELQYLMDVKFDYSTETRDEDGYNDFSDLIFKIAEGLKWMRLEKLDQKIMNYQEVRPLLQILEGEVSNHHLIDDAEDMVSSEYYAKYRENLKTGAKMDTNTKNLERRDKRIKAGITKTNIIGLKALLDEVNFIVFNTKKQLGSKIDLDTNLMHLFNHIYPADTQELYTKIYGLKPEVGIFRKYINNVCNLDDDSLLDFDEATNQIVQFWNKKTTQPIFEGKPLDPNDIYYFLEPRKKDETTWTPTQWNDYIPYTKVDLSVTTLHDLKTYYVFRTSDTLSDIHKECPIYIRSEYTSKDLREVYEARNQAWKTRDQIQLDKNITDAIAKGSYVKTIFVRNYIKKKISDSHDWYFSIEGLLSKAWHNNKLEMIDEAKQVDIVKVFGKEYAADALKLLGILDANKMWWKKQGTSSEKNIDYYTVELRKTQFTPKQLHDKYIYPSSGRNPVIGEQEFKDVRSVLNYIYKHIINNAPNLENTYNNPKKIFKWEEKIDQIYKGR